MRFTLDGSETLERRIADDMANIRAAVLDVLGPEDITALVLGGGYGRGEGGVYVIDGEERVYNDYDFFVVVPFSSRRRRNRVSSRLCAVKDRFEPECGIHVDFGPPMPLAGLPRQPYELMFMELKAGHHVIYGPERVLAALPEYDSRKPPLEEGARLFMNRGIGLLMAHGLLREERPLNKDEHEFVVRNIQKAYLAMGDGVLFIQEAYSPSYSERLKRFEVLNLSGVPGGEQLRHDYKAALEFKFRPQHDVPSGKSLAEWHQESTALFSEVFLWFERNRLNKPSLTWDDYGTLATRLPHLSARNKAKNLFRNLRKTKGSWPPLKECYLHPRDRILKYLPNLLNSAGATIEDEALVLKLWEHFG